MDSYQMENMERRISALEKWKSEQATAVALMEQAAKQNHLWMSAKFDEVTQRFDKMDKSQSETRKTLMLWFVTPVVGMLVVAFANYMFRGGLSVLFP